MRARLVSLDSLLVAYSGGTDSAYLAWSARQVLGDRMLAVLADSPSLPRRELKLALEFAEHWKIPVKIISTDEMEREEYTRNDASRCFHCKDELFVEIEEHRRQLGFRYIAYGKNLDDHGDFRPGQRAAQQHHVLSPLAEAALTKQDIRALSRRAGLDIWNKPAAACLSSRIEYGRPVTREALAAIEAGEEALRQLGFQQARVRHHGEIARIEIARDELHRAFAPEMAAQLVPIFKKLGFQYVTLDCEGYRSGSLNAVLPIEQIRMVG
ncbi:MAG: ATP-dependent sacrificial sulfur transferase LarE [Acidobacteria bacterium]|nr:ATP-dependent sacrificial sulfur transferase LarE [Acidobacteriota bacterium]